MMETLNHLPLLPFLHLLPPMIPFSLFLLKSEQRVPFLTLLSEDIFKRGSSSRIAKKENNKPKREPRPRRAYSFFFLLKRKWKRTSFNIRRKKSEKRAGEGKDSHWKTQLSSFPNFTKRKLKTRAVSQSKSKWQSEFRLRKESVSASPEFGQWEEDSQVSLNAVAFELIFIVGKREPT